MRGKILILILMVLVSGCAGELAQKEKSVSELINEIHDLDTETTFLYNNYDDAIIKFSDSTLNIGTLEQLKTIQKYAEDSTEAGKKALEKFDELLKRIGEIKSKDLSTNQRAYTEKLELASTHYSQVIEINEKIIEQKVKFANYSTHAELFYAHFNDLLKSDGKLSIFDRQKDWKALNDELDMMDNSLNLAENEVKIFKAQIPFKFIGEYERFISLMREYISKEKAIAVKRQEGKPVLQTEINEGFNIGIKAGSIFRIDANGIAWVEGEKDEIEAYRRENIDTLEDESQQAYNKADAYYQDAKLLYEQLIKGEPPAPPASVSGQ